MSNKFEYYINSNNAPVKVTGENGKGVMFRHGEGSADVYFRRYVQPGKLSVEIREHRKDSSVVVVGRSNRTVAARRGPRPLGMELRGASMERGKVTLAGKPYWAAPSISEKPSKDSIAVVVSATTVNELNKMRDGLVGLGIPGRHIIGGVIGDSAPILAWEQAIFSGLPWVVGLDARVGISAEKLNRLLSAALADRMVCWSGRTMQGPGWVWYRSDITSAGGDADIGLMSVCGIASAKTIVDALGKARSVGRWDGLAWAVDVALSVGAVLAGQGRPICLVSEQAPKCGYQWNYNGLCSEMLLAATKAGWQPRCGTTFEPVMFLTPTYGRATELGEFLSCVNAQTYPNVHVCILNDAARAIVVESPNVYVHNEKERYATLGHKRNANLKCALKKMRELGVSRAIVMHGDDDDKYLSWHVSQALAALMGSDTAWCVRPRWAWRFNGPTGSETMHNIAGSWPYEGQMCFDGDRAIEVGGYSLVHSGQARALLNAFVARGRMAYYDPWPWESYIYRYLTDHEHVSRTKQATRCADFGDGKPLAIPPAAQVYGRFWPKIGAWIQSGYANARA